MEFKDYLKRHHKQGTAARYEREVKIFLFSLEGKGIDPKLANYGQVMVYIVEQRKLRSAESVRCGLYGIKRYYDYLIAEEIREDHPAKTIYLKDGASNDIQLQDLFSSAELESLLDREDRYLVLRNRNQLILSLLIYQALTSGELCQLKVSDIDLLAESIYIKGGYRTKARTLRLKPKQLATLAKYLAEDRPNLLKQETDNLLIGKLGNAETGEGIGYLVETLRDRFESRKLNPRTIRQSVIANLLKDGNDLRLIQAFAGHKYPSTTERYRQTGIEQLQQAIEKHHPLRPPPPKA